jgi:nickel/cobalt transporter (NicO) family protein
MRLMLLALLTSISLVSVLPAHPVPKDNHDRTLVVRLTPESVVVAYRLEVDETIGALELPDDEKKGIRTRSDLHAAMSRYFSEILADNLAARLDGGRLRFRCVQRSHVVTDHVRCDFRFEAAWSPKTDARHVFDFRESNWELDDFSKLSVQMTADPRLTVLSVSAPSDSLIARPGADRKPGDGEKLRKLDAAFRVGPVVQPADYKPALAPEVFPLRTGPKPGLESDYDNASLGKPLGGEQAAWAKAWREESESAPIVEEQAVHPPARNLMGLLLDSRWGMGMLLLLAGVFGAAHALTPGHGKTMVAAYLIGERGTVWHALVLGVVVTLTHTFAVLILAGLLPIFFPNAVPATVQSLLGIVGGLLIAGLGVWLLMRRLLGQADHIHVGGGHHHHHHDHHHDDEPKSMDGRVVGLGGIVMLGISGGIVPCWDAIAMLGFAISAQRLWLGLPLLLAFSAGLAAVLIVIGIGVVYARNMAGDWWGGQGKRLRPLIRALPLISAILVTVLGFWLCYDSVHLAGGH